MSNLSVRVISALLLAVIGVSALALHPLSRFAMMALVVVLGSWEFARMVDRKFPGTALAPCIAFAVLLFILPLGPFFPGFEAGERAFYFWAVGLMSILALVFSGFWSRSIEVMAPWIFMQMAGFLFFALGGARLFELLRDGTGFAAITPLFLVLVCMTVADSGAYFTGRAFGRHKLAPAISPKKTVEGAIGGLLLTAVAALLVGPLLVGIRPWQGFIFGIVMAITAIGGDLVMSAVKRFAGFKDSSNLLPGHGGFLDRFDSLYLSGPVAAFLLSLFA